jgi:reductive dehalogenase
MLDGDATLLHAATVAVGALIFLLFAYAGLTSVRKGESRAAGVAFALSLILPLPYLLAGLISFDLETPLAAILLALTLTGALLLVIPWGEKRFRYDDTPTRRIDERDIMFSRRLLIPGSARFEEYYADNPEKKGPDDGFRAQPGLLERGTTQYDPYMFSAADATFATVGALQAAVEGEPAPDKVACDPKEMTGFIKNWTLKMGVVSVGVTELREYHLYTIIGRGEHYGKPVELEHDFAIAFSVEMDKEMVDRAPLGPMVMESAQQYLRSGAIAVQIAEFIRRLGYPARAHIDANYRVVCPLVARDAGLGEIGRMGLLMTPELGPRVRIAVVTTDLPLIPDERRYDYTMIDFCVRCKKCADACPSKAISFDDRALIDGVRRWQIDQEACYTLWCKIGTDCGRCISVCPFSHPDNLVHNLVRRGVRNSSLFRRAAIWMDDVFYGKQPPPSRLPGWMKIEAVVD